MILSDEDVHAVASAALVLDTMEAAVLEEAQGALVAPPKFNVATDRGRLTYTAGASKARFGVNGFRVYSVYPDSEHDTDATQVVAVFDDHTGVLKGLCVGSALGAWRTAGLNGVAVRHLAREDARVLGVIGAGFQAPYHIGLALAARDFERIVLTSRTIAKANALAQRLQEEHDIPVEVVDDADVVAGGVDVLLCTTNSPKPVFDPAVLRPGTHVNTIGPKFTTRHELSPAVAKVADAFVTDSVAQVMGYGERFFLNGHVPLESIVGLGRWIEEGQRRDPEAITVFCSVGLAGTEVCLADAIMKGHHTL